MESKRGLYGMWACIGLLIGCLLAASLCGCNTVRGFSQLVQGVGADIEVAATGSQSELTRRDGAGR